MDTEARLRRCVPIQRLSLALQDKAVALATITDYGNGAVIYVEGERDDRVHFLLDGSIELMWQERGVRTVNAAHPSSQQALDSTPLKRYTARTSGGATVASFHRPTLDRLIEQFETSLSDDEFEVSEIDSARSADWMIRMLQSKLFAILPATNIQEIFARFEEVETNAGEVVVEQGSAADYYYIIEQGYCEVSRTIPGGRGHIHLADLGPGTAFGEEALISGRPRNASITMVTDGRLMRLARDDFSTLILGEVQRPIGLTEALGAIDQGAVWLDIRYPEEHARRTIEHSENIPLNMLRLHSNRLRKEPRYVICGDDVEECAIAAFLLCERGFAVNYLTVTIGDAIEAQPGLSAVTEVVNKAPPEKARNDAEVGVCEEKPVMEPSDNDAALGDTITRISSLYTNAQAQREMEEKVPVEKYADTSTGRALADIIDELAEQHDDLDSEPDRMEFDVTSAADFDPTGSLPDALPDSMSEPMPAASGMAPQDGIASLMRDMENRVREHVNTAVRSHTARIESDYNVKLNRLRELTNQEIEQREAALRRRVADEYANKEQLLRGYYKKLIALANNISRQKAQLQDAKKQFASKLASAELLSRQVDEMRALLSDQIGYLDAQEIEEVPELSLTL